MKKLLSLALILTPVLLFAGPDPRGVLELEGYGTGDATGIKATRTRGDFTIQETLASDDKLFFLDGYGFNGTSLVTTPRAQMTFSANQAWTTTANGSYIKFSITPNGSTSMTEAVRITTGPLLSVTGDIKQSGFKVSSPSSSVYSVLFSSIAITPTASFQLISSTGNTTVGQTGVAISTVGFANGTELVLLSTAATVAIAQHSVATPSRVVLSSSTFQAVDITTYTMRAFRLYNGFWFQQGDK